MAFDKDGNGRIDQDELREVFKTLGCEMTDEASFQEVTTAQFIYWLFWCFLALVLFVYIILMCCSSSVPPLCLTMLHPTSFSCYFSVLCHVSSPCFPCRHGNNWSPVVVKVQEVVEREERLR